MQKLTVREAAENLGISEDATLCTKEYSVWLPRVS